MDIKIELLAPGGIDQLQAVPCARQDPGPTEIRLRHEGIGVGFIDIYHRTGLYPLPMPAVLGVEGAGTVEAVGGEVRHLKAGDRVAYAGIPGAYAATRLLPTWRAIKLPEAVDPLLAATAFLRGMTVHMLVTRIFPVRAGCVLLVHAAAGGLGLTLTRWAKHLGATVIGTAGSVEKADIARANGADHVIVGRHTDFAAEVAKLTMGKGVDFAIDGIGGDVLRKTFACVRRFGTVASVGQAAGHIPPITVDELGPVRTLMLARPSVMAYAAEQETYTVAAQAVLDAIERGLITRTVRAYPLAQAAEAQRALEAGETTGSPVLVP
ncbi:MAG: quinone oxidoreductase [Proteobacteria bacterium]|nr:quinone oxidoreductase [Pseudomonadota bacterium]